MGPLIDPEADDAMMIGPGSAFEPRVVGILSGGERVSDEQWHPAAYYVTPVHRPRSPRQTRMLREETFAPILYAMGYRSLELEAIALSIHNDVQQGLSSCIMFTPICWKRRPFCRQCGSDCGIANVNIGPSGAEIGGAFGGEKDTGGGREAGSDALGRATCDEQPTPSITVDRAAAGPGNSLRRRVDPALAGLRCVSTGFRIRGRR